MISNIPKGMVTDQFGMIGLLTFIRAAETEPNLVTLALGRSVLQSLAASAQCLTLVRCQTLGVCTTNLILKHIFSHSLVTSRR